MKFMSQIEFYHNLYVSECWQKKKGKIVKRLKENKLQSQEVLAYLGCWVWLTLAIRN